MASSKTYVLKSSDGETFPVDESVAFEMQTIKNLIEDDCTHNTIPIPNVTGKILSKVIEYCNRHLVAGEGLESFDRKFVKVDHHTLFDLVMAANYLDIKSLLDLTAQAVADFIKDKSVEEMRELLNVKNDFTPEEEAQIRRENAWAFT